MHSRFIFLIILLLLACATQVASDVYTPSLISISHALTGATLNLVQMSVPLFLFGVAISQLFFGPLADAIGRKKPLQVGLITMTLGSLMCALTTSIEQLLLARFIQGIGAGALAALWRTVFRDTMKGEELAKYSSFISVFMIFVVSVAPALGGYFETIGWRSSFIFMLAYCFIVLVFLQFAFKETSQNHHIDNFKVALIKKNYGELLNSRLFMGITTCTFLSYGGLFSWVVVAPALLMKQLHLSSVAFGWVLAIVGATGYAIAAVINGKLVNRVGIPTMMRAGFILMSFSGLLMLVLYLNVGLSLWGVIAPIFIFYFGSTLIWPNAFATAFTPFGHIAGFAGALYGFMQLVGGAIIGSFASHLPDNSPLDLSILIVVTSVTALCIYQWVVMPVLKKQKS